METGLEDRRTSEIDQITVSTLFPFAVPKPYGPREGLHKRTLSPPSLEDMAVKVGNYFNLPLTALGSKSRSSSISKARSVFCLLATKRAGYTQTAIGQYLNLSRIGARNNILRGERILTTCDVVWGKGN